MGADIVEEVTVMADDQYGSVIVHEEVFQPYNAGKVEVVGGLVEKNDVGIAKQSLGKQHFIVIAAEGIKYPGGSISAMAKMIEEATGVETKANVMGHMQRGGSPTNKDRVVASRMGVYAVELLTKGIGNRVVVTKDEKIVDYDILEALAMPATFDKELYDLAYRISI